MSLSWAVSVNRSLHGNVWSINYGYAYAYQFDVPANVYVLFLFDIERCAWSIQAPLPFRIFAHLDFYRLSLSCLLACFRSISREVFRLHYLYLLILCFSYSVPDHFCFYSTKNIYFSSVTFTMASWAIRDFCRWINFSSSVATFCNLHTHMLTHWQRYIK